MSLTRQKKTEDTRRVSFRISLKDKICPVCNYPMQLVGGRLYMSHNISAHARKFRCEVCEEDRFEINGELRLVPPMEAKH